MVDKRCICTICSSHMTRRRYLRKSSSGRTSLRGFLFSFSILQGGLAWEQLQTQVCLHVNDRTVKGKALAKLIYDEQLSFYAMPWLPGHQSGKALSTTSSCNFLQELKGCSGATNNGGLRKTPAIELASCIMLEKPSELSTPCGRRHLAIPLSWIISWKNQRGFLLAKRSNCFFLGKGVTEGPCLYFETEKQSRCTAQVVLYLWAQTPTASHQIYHQDRSYYKLL